MNKPFAEKHTSAWIGRILIAGLLAAAPNASAIVIRHDVPESEYLELASLFPATGALLEDGDGSCSATLVGSNQLLSAAHCLDLNGDGTIDVDASTLSFRVDPVGGAPSVTTQVQSAAIHPSYREGQITFDLAVLTLSNPISGVTPATVAAVTPLGQTITEVGYGLHGTGDTFDVNTASPSMQRLAANNILDFAAHEDQSGGVVYAVDFDSPAGDTNTLSLEIPGRSSAAPLALEGEGAPGDSGGGIYTAFNGGLALFAVNSAGSNPLSLTDDDELGGRYGNVGFFAPVNTESNIAFLRSQGVAVIPEPGSIVLLGLCGLGLLAARPRQLSGA